MALGIEKATIGYDVTRIQALKNKINLEVIEEAKKTLLRGADDLREDIASVWVGQSAENFKDNMKFDAQNICDGMEEARKILEAALDDIVNKMDQVDNSLVRKKG